ncbi:MAG: insulinase family protein [Candidatus Methanoplasma sp.]|jgi:predicted Zn-dependent peptidase|nr:insulinase family protein [Candidatus Methanoplasma sp.]
METESIEVLETPGGVPVIVDRAAGRGSAGYMAAIGTGSRDEDPSLGGISHLLEHVVFRATETRSSYQMSREIEGAGGEMNAFTGREETAFYAVTISETAGVAREMVADVVANPLIGGEDTDLERKIVLQELSMAESEPESYVHDLFFMNFWRGHSLCQDEGGKPEIVERLSSGDLRAYYEERYGAPNMAVFAAGDADPAETAEWAAESFDGMAGKRRVSREPPAPPEAGCFFVKNRSEHCQIAMGLPSYPPLHRLRPAAAVLSGVLGSGTSSRLFQEVREKRALVYSVYSRLEQHSDAGALCAFMSCTTGNAMEAVRAAAGALSSVRREGFEKGEVERTKRLIKGAVVRAAESTERRLYMLSRDFMLCGRAKTLEERLAEIDSVTEEDVAAAASEIIGSGRLNMTVLGRGDRALRRLDASEIDL